MQIKRKNLDEAAGELTDTQTDRKLRDRKRERERRNKREEFKNVFPLGNFLVHHSEF